jgi:hypothetical protein
MKEKIGEGFEYATFSSGKDDFITEKDQHLIEDIFIRGRKNNCSLIYLTQSYFPLQKIFNCSVIILCSIIFQMRENCLKFKEITF